MTRRDWAAWALVLFVCVVIVPLVRWSDTAYAPQTDIAAAVLADGTEPWATPRDTPWWTPDATLTGEEAQTAAVECGGTLTYERAQRGACEEFAPATIAALRATVDAQATRLHRTPYGPDPTAGWRGWLPMAVRSW